MSLSVTTTIIGSNKIHDPELKRLVDCADAAVADGDKTTSAVVIDAIWNYMDERYTHYPRYNSAE